MKHDFSILLEFLHSREAEVLGRQSGEPTPEAAALLERFAKGECTQEERETVCRMLRMYPAWLLWLAERVKRSRVSEPVR